MSNPLNLRPSFLVQKNKKSLTSFLRTLLNSKNSKMKLLRECKFINYYFVFREAKYVSLVKNTHLNLSYLYLMANDYSNVIKEANLLKMNFRLTE